MTGTGAGLRGLVLALLLAGGSAVAHGQAAGPAQPCDGDRAGACRYAAENAALAAAPASERQVVFLGDSLTEGWPGASAGLFARGGVNRGIGGEVTRQMRQRFATDVIALSPRVVHIMAGTNDIAGNDGQTRASRIRDNITAMAKQAKAAGIAVVLASTPPAASFPWAPDVRPVERIRSLNAWMKVHAERNGYVYADYWSVLATPEGGLKADYTTDGVHLSAAGYAAIEPLALAAISEAKGE
jgi:lysophospholipase L1-like esterase